jgi:hypothetical protein
MRDWRADIGRHIGDADERRAGAMALPTEIVGGDAEADDVVGRGEGGQLGVCH